jgi:CobQ-like glutamine amidotransferase family enzyme
MISLYTLFPDRLNLNGDQANILVLQKRLEWAGIASEVVDLTTVKQLEKLSVDFTDDPNGKFLLVGHGSIAAMRSFASMHEAVRSAVLELSKAGLPGLAVGSGYELVIPDFSRGQRLSDYADIAAADGLPRIHGYLNTDTDLPAVRAIGDSFICTMVHGPVLARTPELADLFLGRMGVQVVSSSDSLEADAIAASANQN